MLSCSVGATGFEPATARPPAECATRLRHAPAPEQVYAKVPSEHDANISSQNALKLTSFRCSRCGEIKLLLSIAHGNASRPGSGCVLSIVPRGLRRGALCGKPPAIHRSGGQLERKLAVERTRFLLAFFDEFRARTAERRIPWSWNSTTCGTSRSLLGARSTAIRGKRCSTKWRSATWCVRTATGVARPDDEARFALFSARR